MAPSRRSKLSGNESSRLSKKTYKKKTQKPPLYQVQALYRCSLLDRSAQLWSTRSRDSYGRREQLGARAGTMLQPIMESTNQSCPHVADSASILRHTWLCFRRLLNFSSITQTATAKHKVRYIRCSTWQDIAQLVERKTLPVLKTVITRAAGSSLAGYP